MAMVHDPVYNWKESTSLSTAAGCSRVLQPQRGTNRVVHYLRQDSSDGSYKKTRKADMSAEPAVQNVIPHCTCSYVVTNFGAKTCCTGSSTQLQHVDFSRTVRVVAVGAVVCVSISRASSQA
jgi:hypothetical protein